MSDSTYPRGRLPRRLAQVIPRSSQRCLLRVNGLSLRKIAEELKRGLVPTKNNWVWQANTVKKILDRVAYGRSVAARTSHGLSSLHFIFLSGL